jgi:hypothetical protein
MLCYCTICRKTAGGGGYAINLHGWASTLEVSGEAQISVYRARLDDGTLSPAERRFCSQCGSSLWVWDPRWPELMHPFASAVDSPLPAAPSRTRIMLAYKPDWLPVDADPVDRCHDEYPDTSLEDWHREQGLWEG